MADEYKISAIRNKIAEPEAKNKDHRYDKAITALQIALRKEEIVVPQSPQEKKSHRTAGLIILAVIIIFGIVLFTDNTIGHLLGGPVIKAYVLETAETVKDETLILGCSVDNFARTTFGGLLNPAEAEARAKLVRQKNFDDFQRDCRKQVFGIGEAEEIGCTECYSITKIELDSLEKVTVEQNSQKNVRFTFTVDTPEGKQYCRTEENTQICEIIPFALPPIDETKQFYEVKLKGDKKNEFIEGTFRGRCSDRNNCKDGIHPNVAPFSIRSTVPVSCENLVNVKTSLLETEASLNYQYNTIGTAFVRISPEELSPDLTERKSITLPGPVKFDVIPDAKEFFQGDDKEVGIRFKFRNKGGVGGKSTAQINDIILVQTPPLQLSNKPLQLLDCEVSEGEEIIINDATHYTIPFSKTLTSDSQPTGIISCFFSMPEVSLEDKVTYKFTASASYDYTYTKAGDVIEVENKCGVGETATKEEAVAGTTVETFVVEGMVTDEEGNTISDVLITYTKGDVILESTTNSEGKFTLNLENGNYDIALNKEGYVEHTDLFSVESENKILNFVLTTS